MLFNCLHKIQKCPNYSINSLMNNIYSFHELVKPKVIQICWMLYARRFSTFSFHCIAWEKPGPNFTSDVNRQPIVASIINSIITSIFLSLVSRRFDVQDIDLPGEAGNNVALGLLTWNFPTWSRVWAACMVHHVLPCKFFIHFSHDTG